MEQGLSQEQFPQRESKSSALILLEPSQLLQALVCADNTGAKILRVIQVTRYKGRHSRQTVTAVGDFVTVTVKKGPAELRKQVFGAVIVRQKYPIRRLNGLRIAFEDNAECLLPRKAKSKALISKDQWRQRRQKSGQELLTWRE